jgi:hypothetical protein
VIINPCLDGTLLHSILQARERLGDEKFGERIKKKVTKTKPFER